MEVRDVQLVNKLCRITCGTRLSAKLCTFRNIHPLEKAILVFYDRCLVDSEIANSQGIHVE